MTPNELIARAEGPIRQAASDLIDSYFGAKKCLAKIPADPENDADLVLTKGIADLTAALKEQTARAERAEADLAETSHHLVCVAASLAAAISLLERGGKKAAPSDKMFVQMLKDYATSLKRARATLAAITGDVLAELHSEEKRLELE